jgi:hypothetical protein
MLTTSPLCTVCVHLRKETVEGPAHHQVRPTCDAFPDGIPVEILKCADHRVAWPGDNGIRFELQAGEELPVMFR